MTKRRTFLKRLLVGVLGIGGIGFYTWKIEPHWLEFVQVKMPIPNLPPHLKGKKLMQISDLHIGDTVHTEFLLDAFQKAKALTPDFVVYTGDYVSYQTSRQLTQMGEVMEEAVRGKYATLGVLGNHDYGRDWSESEVADEVTGILQDLDIAVLRNEQQSVEGLNFIGLDDLWGTNFHPEKVMGKVSKEAANVVLCHNPDAVDEEIWKGYEGWILSGHTHGGQCKPPFLPPPLLPVRNRTYTAGLFELEGNRKLYINRALGNLLHIRFNVRPEITVFELC